MRNSLRLIIVFVLLILISLGFYWFKPKTEIVQPTPENKPTVSAIEYINSQYGFKILLPQDWQNYSIIVSEWQANDSNQKGPIVSIRNPKWTKDNPYQDIPIMVFTSDQWGQLISDKIHVGAAPINPKKLGFNEKYVLALPARYNYAFPSGWEEVEKIIENNSDNIGISIKN